MFLTQMLVFCNLCLPCVPFFLSSVVLIVEVELALSDGRSEHFVQVGKTWKLQTLIFNEEYKQASGQESEFLWNPKYQAPECFY